MKIITKLSELNTGNLVWIASKQFGAVNPAVFLSHDRTSLKRPIGYLRFDRMRCREAEFAVYQRELDSGDTVIIQRGLKCGIVAIRRAFPDYVIHDSWEYSK